jgi:hypothetical protein
MRPTVCACALNSEIEAGAAEKEESERVSVLEQIKDPFSTIFLVET